MYKVQDALLIHVMYSLALDSYLFYILTNENKCRNETIFYWDYKQNIFLNQQSCIRDYLMILIF